ncbi:MAG: hypothetical protein A4S17_06795 [Proteobacteria bacterium HN_bin10]|jgi:hypothetical protein|nr:MAG: hypothetical protein A4S17_06795 [Proteobacteria bacterium HN_bin10]
MSEAIVERPSADARTAPQSILRASAIAWFIPALIGNWLFAYHVAKEYFVTALGGNIATWNERLFVGLVQGDLAGNLALVAHLIIAFLVTIGGTLQLIPQLRARAPSFHRWNGRLYIVMAFITAIAALYMVWTRDTFGPDSLEVSVSINAVLIMICAAMTLRHAMARRIDVHHRWALRTFMVMSGVWFLRVIYACIGVVTQGEMLPGIASDMSGPLDLVISFSSYLLPLAILELYLQAQRSPGAAAKLAAAGLVLVAAGTTSIGVFGTAVGWLS